MVGNAVATEAIDRELPDRIFRYVNDQDPVPLLPTLSLLANSYSHCQKQIALGLAAAAAAEAVTAVEFFKHWAGKTTDGVIHGTLLDDIWQSMKERVSAHLMTNYRNRVAELLRKD
jgi:hypothetical protein